jgi:AraC family transcriptional regulator of arabinose operon
MPAIKRFYDPPIGADALRINGIGVQEAMPPCDVDRPLGTGDFLFMVFYDDVRIGGAEGLSWYAPNYIRIWLPGAAHRYGNPKRAWSHSWLHCDGSFVKKTLEKERIETRSPIGLADASFVDRHLLAMHHEITAHQTPDMVIVRNHLQNWIREIGRALRGDQSAGNVPQHLADLRMHLEAHYREHVTLKDLASRANISVPHLCSEFKKHFGVPVIDYVIRRRMHEAAYLLHDHNLNITEIAQRVGYDDIYHFSKLFKKHYGKSPRNVRKGYLVLRRP